jgi:hypothetical protein
MRKTQLTIIAATVFCASAAFAATQGTLGVTSTGTVDITIPIGNVVQISGLVDFNVGIWSPGDPDVALAQDVCVYANNTGGDYLVTTTSLNEGGTGFYRLFDGATGYVPYQVGWTDAPGSNFAGSTAEGPGTPFNAPGDPSVNQDNGSTTDPTCAGGTAPTATLSVQILAADLGAAPDGMYGDTLTIVVQPN